MNYRVFARSLRSAAVVFAAAGFAACDDDGAGPDVGLQPEDIASIYDVCQLVFDPAGSILPSVNIAETAFEISGNLQDPEIGFDPNPQQTIELTYVPKGQVNDRELHGNYTIRGGSTVEVRFNASGVDPEALLIPENRRLDFAYQESPLRLSMAASSQYDVTREAYVELTGEDPQNLPETISGVLVADFRSAGCGGN